MNNTSRSLVHPDQCLQWVDQHWQPATRVTQCLLLHSVHLVTC